MNELNEFLKREAEKEERGNFNSRSFESDVKPLLQYVYREAGPYGLTGEKQEPNDPHSPYKNVAQFLKRIGHEALAREILVNRWEKLASLQTDRHVYRASIALELSQYYHDMRDEGKAIKWLLLTFADDVLHGTDQGAGEQYLRSVWGMTLEEIELYRSVGERIKTRGEETGWSGRDVRAESVLEEFIREHPALDILRRLPPDESARREVLAFRSWVERQAYKDIHCSGSPQENIARALLQAYLQGRSYREVPVRGGQTNILVFTKNGRFLYETKIWRGPAYHAQGIREIDEYIAGEDDDQELSGVFYIVFDPTRSMRAREYTGGDVSSVDVHGHKVEVIVVNVAPPTPSKK